MENQIKKFLSIATIVGLGFIGSINPALATSTTEKKDYIEIKDVKYNSEGGEHGSLTVSFEAFDEQGIKSIDYQIKLKNASPLAEFFSYLGSILLTPMEGKTCEDKKYLSRTDTVPLEMLMLRKGKHTLGVTLSDCGGNKIESVYTFETD